MTLAAPSRGYETLTADPLAGWIETTFGLATETHTNQIVRQRPVTVPAAAERLAEASGLPAERCQAAIQAILQEGARVTDPRTGRPLFAFRLHQFLSKGDTVYVSLEPEGERHITSQKQVSVPGHRDRILLPLAFCRECGQEYLVVARVSRNEASSYTARQDQDAAGRDAVNGYLYVSADQPWPADPLLAGGRLPDSWYDAGGDGAARVLPRLVDHLPREVWLSPGGAECPPGEGLRAAYVPSPFRFCLRCRVSYEQARGRDFAKLATFAAEGRSSAVTLISTSIVRNLRHQADLPDEARKLLTFVDNRQDASLQAGHLNDFVQVTQIRGALFRAAQEVGERGLRHDDVAQRVALALDPPLASFAQNPGVKFSQRDYVVGALRSVLAYRVYSDLERGWRVTMPNLEQTGLLRFDYVDLDESAADDDYWADAHPVLRDDEPAHRAEIARILLDEMRRALAVDVDVLSQEGFERLQQLSDQQLTGEWALPPDEPRVVARTVYGRPGGPGGSRDAVHFTGRSALGRYLRRRREFPTAAGPLTTDDAQAIIVSLLRTLQRYGQLTAVAHDRDGAVGYRLKSSALS